MLGGGLARGLVKKAVAAAAAAGAGFVAIVALGATIFYALCLIVPEMGAAAITFAVFAVIALVIALVYLKGDSEPDEEDEPVGMGQRAFALFRERPILGAVAALAGGWIFLRNPALATMVAAAFTEKSHGRRRY